MKTFDKAVEQHLDKLELFVPVVARVHGEHHPEFHDFKKVYDEMIKKIKKADSGRPDLEEDFKQLREISDDYTVPGDVCESYEAVFQMVSELDQAYREQ